MRWGVDRLRNNRISSELRLNFPADFNRFDHVSFLYFIDAIHPIADLGEYGVIVVQPEVVYEIDEYLRIPGIPAARRDTQSTTAMRQQSDFIPHEIRIADVFIGSRTSALQHEIRYDAVKCQAVVIARLRQLNKFSNSNRSLFRKQLNRKRSCFSHMNDRRCAHQAP